MADAGKLKSICYGYMGQLVKKYKEIEVLLLHFENADQVRAKASRLSEVFSLFHEKVKEFHEVSGGGSMPDFTSAEQNHQEFRCRLQEWFSSADQQNAVQGVVSGGLGFHGNSQPVLPSTDNVSHKSSSVTSQASRSSSTRLKEARVKRELAILRAQQLETEQKLLREKTAAEANALHEQTLKQEQLQSLKVKHELDQANLECSLLEGEHSDIDVNSVLKGPVLKKSVNLKCENACTVPNVPNAQFSQNPVIVDDHGMTNKQGVQYDSMNDSHDMYGLVNAMLLNLNMPKQEIGQFEGDPADYHIFMHNFEVNIESKVSDPNTRLTYLLQYCSGKAKHSIENCVLLGSDGYHKAREILQTQYGHPHIVAHSMLEKLCSRSQIKSNDSDALWSLAQEIQRCQITLSKIGSHTSTDQLLKIQRILPLRLQGEWAKRAKAVMQIGREPNFDDMYMFVQNAALIGSTVFGRSVGQFPSNDKTKLKGKNTFTKVSSYATQNESNGHGQVVSKVKYNGRPSVNRTPYQQGQTRPCVCCSGNHKLEECVKFKQMSLVDRLSFMKSKWLCHNCFYPYHYARGCISMSACSIEGCDKKHHTLLHFTHRENGSDQTQLKVVEQSSSNAVSLESSGQSVCNTGNNGEGDCEPGCSKLGSASAFATDSRVGVYLRVVPVIVQGPDREIETLALLDSGSQITLCSKKLFECVGLKGSERPLVVNTMNGVKSMNAVRSDMKVKSVASDDVIDMNVTAVDEMPISCTLPESSDICKWRHLQNIDFPTCSSENKEVLLLIGADVPEVFWVLDERRGDRKQPFAIKSVLGWTLSGPSGSSSSLPEEVGVGFVLASDLMDQVKKFWETDFGDSLIESPKSRGDSVEDRRAQTIMDDTVTLTDDSHYKLGLLWRSPEPYLPHNVSLALTRLNILKRKFQRDKDLHEKYTEVLQGYIDKGHARVVPEVSDSTADCDTSTQWYLPHHPVYNPHKKKLRVVFDCSASFGGTSLNDQLLKGPDLLNSLVGVLIRFREEHVAIVADVEAMFHQVRVIEKDCGALKFLWWPDGDITKDPVTYQMVVHIFGASSSPCCANFALRKAATDNASDYDELTVKTVLEDFYVDDCLQSVKTTDLAQRLVGQLCAILARGGFRLTKWLSNDRDVIQSVPEMERAGSVKEIDLEKELPVERTLGVQWNVERDSF